MTRGKTIAFYTSLIDIRTPKKKKPTNQPNEKKPTSKQR